jgi:dihydroorotate dehydrogenase (NAD+) catalytic subunit
MCIRDRRAVYDLARALDIPVIGIGGITTWQDAVEFLLAGASALQIGTAVSLRGWEVFREISEGIERYLEEEGFSSVREIVGLALE